MTETVYFSDSSGRLFNWDQDTDLITFIGSMSQTMTDISVAPDGTLYGITFFGLYTIDPVTAATTFLASHNVPGANALLIDPFGTALAAGSSGILYDLDLITGSAIALGDTGFASAGDIALHRGRFYLSSTTEDLVLIDPASGSAISSFNHGVANLFGMSSGPSGFRAFAGDQIFNVNLGAGTLTLEFDLDDRSIVSGSIYGAAPTDYGQSGSVIRGTGATQQLDGAGLDDIIFGAGGFDLINGSNGNDLLFGEADIDTLNGGAGSDTLVGGAGGDVLNGGAGVDAVDYRQSDAAVVINLFLGTAAGGDAVGDTFNSIEDISGSNFDDTLTGTNADNSIIGAAGDDSLVGLSGDDRLQGLLGDDSLFGGFGSDRAEGGAGNDFIRTGPDNDTLLGGDGNDTLGASNRTDLLRGGAGNDLMLGSNGNDRLFGEDDDDTLLGGNGRDTIEGGAGADRIVGGNQDDTASYADAAAGVAVNLANGTGTTGEAAGDVLIDIEDLLGSAFGDTLIGDSDDNRIAGGAGDDFISAGGGADQVIGGAGDDTMLGETGNDSFIFFAAAGGADSIADFQAGTGSGDVIRLIGYGNAFDTFAEVMAAASQIGSNTVIDFGGGNSIALIGVNKTSLASDDFILG